jgi:hypothetical protein
MFHVGFGSAKREAEIRKIGAADRTTALILAAVHFEWMLKRAILKLGTSSTKSLRAQLEDVFRIRAHNNQDGYKEIWDREVGKRFKNASLGTVLGKLTQIQNHAWKVRGKVIHGNGTVRKADADEAIDLFLGSGGKLQQFAQRNREDLDTKLKARAKPRMQA